MSLSANHGAALQHTTNKTRPSLRFFSRMLHNKRLHAVWLRRGVRKMTFWCVLAAAFAILTTAEAVRTLLPCFMVFCFQQMSFRLFSTFRVHPEKGNGRPSFPPPLPPSPPYSCPRLSAQVRNFHGGCLLPRAELDGVSEKQVDSVCMEALRSLH